MRPAIILSKIGFRSLQFSLGAALSNMLVIFHVGWLFYYFILVCSFHFMGYIPNESTIDMVMEDHKLG